MYIFNLISLLGGLAMFLYGMRLMSGTLKESSSGTLRNVMEKVTNNPVKAFFLGLLVTAIIQSSTATIVITSGLVAAGIITLRQSLGIIIGANVGTTVTGQIIRLLDVDAGGSSWLQIFQPSTLAPLALILGMVLIMGFNFKKSQTVGGIAVGFGILFMGLLEMTESVSILTENGTLDGLLASLGNNSVLGYLVGFIMAFVLQSSSASIGIIQAFSMSAEITFQTTYIMLLGIYLGDCITTAIVCSIGAKADSKRVGMVDIIYNIGKTLFIIIVVTIVHKVGLLDALWTTGLRSGGIANINTIFNLGCAVALLPFTGYFEKLSRKIIKDDKEPENKYAEKLAGLSTAFFNTPGIAFKSCYEVLRIMLESSVESINKALDLLFEYDAKRAKEIEDEEENIDMMTDAVARYMVQLNPHIHEDVHVSVLDQYYKDATEFERLGDHAMNLTELANELKNQNLKLSDTALSELEVVRDLLNKIMGYAIDAFEQNDAEAARHIEPLEEVVDDMISMLHDDHLDRLREGKCTIQTGTTFLDVLSNIERISDICSNIGIATVARINPELADLAHTYVTSLHTNEVFNEEYHQAHDWYFSMLKATE